MNAPFTVQVRDFTGGPFAVSAHDGQRVHDVIAPALKEGTPVVLSFAGIETVIAAFLSTAIGQLYGEMASDDVDALLSARDLGKEEIEVLKLVVANCKRYYQNKEAYDQAWAEEMEAV